MSLGNPSRVRCTSTTLGSSPSPSPSTLGGGFGLASTLDKSAASTIVQGASFSIAGRSSASSSCVRLSTGSRTIDRPAIPADGVVEVFKKALVPLDGSDEAVEILPYVSQIAQRLGAELLLLSVLDPQESGIPQTDFSKYAVDADGRARQYLRHLIARLAEQGVTARAWVSTGDAAEQIVGVAAHHGCDLIAMSTHGRTALGRASLARLRTGSCTRRRCPC